MMHGDATHEMVFPVRWFVDTTFMCNYLKVLKRLFMLPTCELVVMIVMLELRSSLVGQLLSAFLGSGLCYMTQQYP